MINSLPVFPEVGSIMVSPGFKRPAFSASSTILLAILSFTLPPALKYSHLATRIESNQMGEMLSKLKEKSLRKSHWTPSAWLILLILIIGVFPIFCKTLSKMGLLRALKRKSILKIRVHQVCK